MEKGDFYCFGRDAVNQAENVFSARTDASHREHRRKVVGPALSPGKIAAYEPIISKNVSCLLSRLAKAQSSCKDVAFTNIASYVHGFTFDTIVEIIFGEPICSEPYTDSTAARDVLTGFRNVSKFAWGASYLPWFGWLMSTRPMVSLTRRPTYDAEGNMTSIGALAARTLDLVLAHPEKAQKSTQPSILKSYLSVPSSDAKHMEPYQIWRECFNLVFAGPGSTAAALTAIFFELGSPHGRKWQERIHAGLSADAAPAGSSAMVLAVIKETLRLHSPFPTAFPRVIATGAETAIPDLAVPLPVGSLVAANTYVLGRSKEIWGDDADKWKPERWLRDENDIKRLEDKFVVFGKGPRGCIGKEMAMLVMEKTVVGVLEKWDLIANGSVRGASFLEMQYMECGIAFVEVGTK